MSDGESGRERKLSRTKQRKFKATKPDRSRGKSIFVFVAILIIVLAVLGYVLSQPAHQPGIAGDIAPDFTLHVVSATGLSNQSVTLSSLRGKVVVLEFMVSWCPICQEMAPSVEYLNQKYSGQDVVFLSVAGTISGPEGTGTAESTTEFIKQYKTTWTYVLDTDSSVFSTYKINATPTFLILDKSGVILAKFQGAVATAALSDAIDHALS